MVSPENERWAHFGLIRVTCRKSNRYTSFCDESNSQPKLQPSFCFMQRVLFCSVLCWPGAWPCPLLISAGSVAAAPLWGWVWVLWGWVWVLWGTETPNPPGLGSVGLFGFSGVGLGSLGLFGFCGAGLGVCGAVSAPQGSEGSSCSRQGQRKGSSSSAPWANLCSQKMKRAGLPDSREGNYSFIPSHLSFLLFLFYLLFLMRLMVNVAFSDRGRGCSG